MCTKIKTKKDKGVSLYFVILILFVLTAVLLALVNLSVSQIKIISGINHSVSAFFAADTGVERALYNIRKEGVTGNFSGSLDDGASYDVEITISAETLIKSTGLFKNTRRALETKY